MRSGSVGFAYKPVLFLCSSKLELGRLIEISKRLSGGKEIVLMLDADKRLKDRLLPAFANALARRRDNISRSRSLQIETLLLACGSMNIGYALSSCGAKSSDNFAVFASSRKAFDSFANAGGVKALKALRLKVEPDEASDVAATELLAD